MSGPQQLAKRATAPATGKVVRLHPELTSIHIPTGAAMPTFTWDMLEHQLASLAVTSQQRDLASSLVSGTRKQAAFKPPEQVLREILCIASVLMDETFHPEAGASGSGEGEMT